MNYNFKPIDSYGDDLNYIQMLRPNRIGYNYNLTNYDSRLLDRDPRLNMQNRFYQNEYPNINSYPYRDNLRGVDDYTYGNNLNGTNNFVKRYNNLDYTLYYPAIYRIINPVVKKVLYSSNIERLDEDLFNNLTDTVFNIVDGDIPKENIENTNINNQETVNQNNQSRNMNLNKDMTKPNDYSQINRNKQY